MKAAGQNVLKPTFGTSVAVPSQDTVSTSPKPVVMTNPSVSRQISVEEYRSLSAPSVLHAERKALFVVNGEVYDGTAFLNEHPGGADSIWLAAGEPDASEDFFAIHSDDAKRRLVPVSLSL